MTSETVSSAGVAITGCLLLLLSLEVSVSSPLEVIGRQSFLFLGMLLSVVGFGWCFTIATGGIVRSPLKLLDWALVGLNLCLMPLFEVLALPPWLWILLVVYPSVLFRVSVTIWLRKANKTA